MHPCMQAHTQTHTHTQFRCTCVRRQSPLLMCAHCYLHVVGRTHTSTRTDLCTYGSTFICESQSSTYTFTELLIILLQIKMCLLNNFLFVLELEESFHLNGTDVRNRRGVKWTPYFMILMSYDVNLVIT